MAMVVRKVRPLAASPDELWRSVSLPYWAVLQLSSTGICSLLTSMPCSASLSFKQPTAHSG